MGKIKAIIKSIISLGYINKPDEINENAWSGNFTSWLDAKQNCTGYENNNILERCKSSLLKVKNGEAVYERDSVLFDKVQYSWPLLTCLQSVASENNNCLHVIDFGGSLGSSYFQNRHFLKNISSLKWIIVEQPHFVDCGKENFQNEHLSFEHTIDEALKKNDVHCLVLSSVLQYLPDPVFWIEKFCSYNFKNILIDRTGFTSGNESVLTVQKVPETIYSASYPCWFFNESKFLSLFENTYKLISEFDDCFTNRIENNNSSYYWKGFFLKKL